MLPRAPRAPSPLVGEGWGGGGSSQDSLTCLATRKANKGVLRRDPPTRRAKKRGDLPRKGGGVMIGKLRGVIDSYGEDAVVLDVGGVGYLVHCSARTMQALPAPGEAATLSIETYVRED